MTNYTNQTDRDLHRVTVETIPARCSTTGATEYCVLTAAPVCGYTEHSSHSDELAAKRVARRLVDDGYVLVAY